MFNAKMEARQSCGRAKSCWRALRAWGCGFFGSPPTDGTLLVAGVVGYLSAVAGDAEMGVLDVHGDDLVDVGGADAEPLAGDHDDAVAGDLALDADRPGRRTSATPC